MPADVAPGCSRGSNPGPTVSGLPHRECRPSAGAHANAENSIACWTVFVARQRRTGHPRRGRDRQDRAASPLRSSGRGLSRRSTCRRGIRAGTAVRGTAPPVRAHARRPRPPAGTPAGCISAALGLSTGSAPNRFLVGLAVLSLLAEVAAKRPLVPRRRRPVARRSLFPGSGIRRPTPAGRSRSAPHRELGITSRKELNDASPARSSRRLTR